MPKSSELAGRQVAVAAYLAKFRLAVPLEVEKQRKSREFERNRRDALTELDFLNIRPGSIVSLSEIRDGVKSKEAVEKIITKISATGMVYFEGKSCMGVCELLRQLNQNDH